MKQQFPAPSGAHAGTRQRWWRSLAALLLVLGILSTAAHTAIHAGEPVDDTCTVCLIGKGLDHAVSQLPLIPTADASHSCATRIRGSRRPSSRPVGFRNRSPPPLLDA